MASRASRRASIVPCGVDPACEESLIFHDEFFFGESEEAAAAVDTSSSEEEGSVSGSLLKRFDAGSDLEESDLVETLDCEPLNESFLSYADPEQDEVERALIASQIQDW